MRETLLELKDVALTYQTKTDEIQAVKNLSFSLKEKYCLKFYKSIPTAFPPTKLVSPPYLLPTSSLLYDKDQVGRRYE